MYTVDCITFDLHSNRTIINSEQFEEREKALKVFDSSVNCCIIEAEKYNDGNIKVDNDKAFYIEFGSSVVIICLKCD